MCMDRLAFFVALKQGKENAMKTIYIRNVDAGVLAKLDEIANSKHISRNKLVTRVYTDADRMFQVRELKKIYTELQQNGIKLTGKMNELIAEDLNISKTQVARYNFVETHGTEELKEKVADGEITIRAAESVAHLSPSKQAEILKKEEITSASAEKEMKKIEKKKAQRKDNKLKKDNILINLSEASILNLELNKIKSNMEILDSKWNDAVIDEKAHTILSIKMKQLNDILDFIIKKIEH